MKVLMIGAHQDDNEICCGGLAHKYVKMGYEVRFLSVCDGSGGHHMMTPEETVARRAKESKKVAEFLGIRYDVWDIVDCNLVADLSTRKRMIRYIREYNPDMIITHRTNDYMPDHRACGWLVQDASYLLMLPHECPDVPAMNKMPLIMYYEDGFSNPVFKADIIIDIDDDIDKKMKILDIHESQFYEWLPYVEENGAVAPKDPEGRRMWLMGMEISKDTTDEEIMNAERGYGVSFAKTAARFRKELIEKYGSERGSKVRYAEAFEFCEYGGALTEELKEKLFSF